MPPPSHESVSVKIAGTELSFETGRIARQASGAVLGRSGDHVVLATVVVAPGRAGLDFFPLTVEYREKLAAAGRIPGSFNRREGRITDHEILHSRLIDRSIRSLFPKGYRAEVQVQVTVLSAEPGADTTTLAILSACAALHLSAAPADGPAAGLRIVRRGETWSPFPSARERADAELDFVVSYGPNGLVMVEGEAREAAEDVCVAAMTTAGEWLGKVQKAFDTLRQRAGKPKDPLPEAASPGALPDAIEAALAAALAIPGKAERNAAIDAARARLAAERPDAPPQSLDAAFQGRRSELVRNRIFDGRSRLDGRGPDAIRPIWCEVGWLPRAHGSAIFTRGETQALVTCTLGTDEDGQRIEDLDGSHVEHFLLHYNFPPYSVGEVRSLRGPGRREIGHGALARRGLAAVLPSFAEFPYTIRVESEISESNGSSSMATVCGGCLALMHAGVPLRRPVAGIAMGLVSDGHRTAVLSDILGDEDHLGDMDFKVVGTEVGVTALQLDNKIGGLEPAQLAAAVAQATTGLRHILGEMAKTLSAPASEIAARAPKVSTTSILPESISVLVGPRGANIKSISAESKARVNVDDDGVVRIYAADGQSARKALRLVGKSVGVVRAGGYYTGTVTGVKDFGVFVRINDVVEGLVPRDELHERSDRDARETLEPGQDVVVRVLGADDRGRLRLSRRAAIGIDEALIEF
jgi:polyribonucleotide nucleotidyltransferase